MDTKEPEDLNLLHTSPVDENGGVLAHLDHVEGEVIVLAPHGQVSDHLPIGCLVVGDQADRPVLWVGSHLGRLP